MDIESKITKMLVKNHQKTDLSYVKLPECSYFNRDMKDKLRYFQMRLKYMEESFLELLKIEKFESINHTSIQPFYTFGMISSLTGSALSVSDCYLFGVEYENMVHSRLILDDVATYSLFNGQMVALKCTSTNGKDLVVSVIYPFPVLDASEEKKKNLHMLVSKGPYSEEKIEFLVAKNVPVLALLGPYICEKSAQNSFEEFVEILENKLKKNMVTKIILVPSLDDHTFMSVVPQPGVDLGSHRIHCGENPGVWHMNGHVVAISNFDVISDISSNEITKDSARSKDILSGKSAIERICHHLIFQRSFVPVFPSSLPAVLSSSLNMNMCPDILITSSKTESFFQKTGIASVVNICEDSEMICELESAEGGYNFVFKPFPEKYL